MLGIYLHIPFCRRRCSYCDFCSSVSPPEKISAYTEALIRNIRAYAGRGLSADTVYFGGGTPSLLTENQLKMVLSAVFDSFSISESAEITMEANPGTVTKSSLLAYKEAGVNRLSFGVQSAADEELSALGRLHSFAQAEEAVKTAQDCGITNISCDLMMGIPRQTRESLARSVEALCGLEITHISAYMLKIEEGTPFDCSEIRSQVAGDDEAAEMYLQTVKMLSERGFEQYEISNFAKNGAISRHNYKYWTGEQYLGFGPSAHSLFEGRRFFVPDDIDGFIAAPVQQLIIEDDCPDPLVEYIMLGLRTSRGVSFDRLGELGANPHKFRAAAAPLAEAGLMRLGENYAKLTPEGFLVSNGIIAKMIESQDF